MLYFTSRPQVTENEELLANRLRLHYSSTAGNRKLRAARKIGNFLSTKFSIAWLPVFDGFRPRSGRDLLATGGCIQRERLFSSKNIAPWEYIHLRKTFAEANLCFHVISSQVQTYRCRR